ncbi:MULTISPECIES: hypothetical protein [unclassified Nostoc]|uniref:Uncharacterized protein n=2 Tax=Nostoc TaxID=1177 RepID=A0A367RIP7_NOSPU|nr:hypothetical protein [Nostoc sp. JL31]RCJ36426.1 hypothetical protein A6769_17165 [Nostoc punctiforme NIES-2108]
MLNLAQGGLMIDRFLNLIFIDSFAVVINLTFGTLLRTKICNYSWDGVVNDELSTPESNVSSSESSPSLEEVETTPLP